MKINSVRLISYGKFKNKEINFSDRLNIITGDNESGKSTVMSFIRGMLYGFSGRGNDLTKNERKKYIPWDGDVLAGEMNIETNDGRRLTLIRKTGKTQAKDEYSVINTDTGEETTFDAEAELGIGEAGFKNTVYIKQSGAVITGENDEISNKLISLMQSGDEGGGYYKAVDALADEMRKLKLFKGNGGIIYDLNCKITALTEELSEIERHNEKQLDAVKTHKALAQKIEKLTESLKKIESNKVKAETQRLFIAEREAKNKKAQAILEHENAQKAKAKTEEALSEYSVFEADADEIIFTPAQSCERYVEDAKKAKKSEKKFKSFAILAFIVALITGIAAIFVLPVVAMAVVFVAAGITLLSLASKQKKMAKQAETEISGILAENEKRKTELAKYGCETLKQYTEKKAEFTALYERHKAICDKMNALERDVERAQQAVDETQKEIQEKFGEPQNFEMVPVTIDPVQEAGIRSELDTAIKEYERLGGQLAAGMQGRRTFDIVEAERMKTKEELSEAETKYAALELAKKTLDSAYEQISRYFSPALSEKASDILGRLTGREEKILSDKKFGVTLDRKGLHEIDYFSCGTAEQAYLALRIAIADIILGDRAPLFLDDSFTTYDSIRAERVLSLLREMGKTRQIIVFSCRQLSRDAAETINL